LADYVAEYTITDVTIPTFPAPVPVMSVFGWIIIHQKIGFAFNWNLPLASYRNGFGAIGTEVFWLGLEKMYQATSCSGMAYRLRVEFRPELASIWYSAEYWKFSVGNEATTKYTLTVAGFSGEVGDSLMTGGFLNYEKANSQKFTTTGVDNDGSMDGNCADMNQGGWWLHQMEFALHGGLAVQQAGYIN